MLSYIKLGYETYFDTIHMLKIVTWIDDYTYHNVMVKSNIESYIAINNFQS